MGVVVEVCGVKMPGVCTMEMNVAVDRAQASCRQAVMGGKTALQSMNDYVDLVKSHLMYAVREEVEVLKEQIKELMERLHKLEQENKVLRSEATPETLSKLPAPLPPIQNPLLQQLMTSLHNPPSSSSST